MLSSVPDQVAEVEGRSAAVERLGERAPRGASFAQRHPGAGRVGVCAPEPLHRSAVSAAQTHATGRVGVCVPQPRHRSAVSAGVATTRRLLIETMQSE